MFDPFAPLVEDLLSDEDDMTLANPLGRQYAGPAVRDALDYASAHLADVLGPERVELSLRELLEIEQTVVCSARRPDQLVQLKPG
jgi:hypothetical protein